jgi:hypothetical protein
MLDMKTLLLLFLIVSCNSKDGSSGSSGASIDERLYLSSDESWFYISPFVDAFTSRTQVTLSCVLNECEYVESSVLGVVLSQEVKTIKITPVTSKSLVGVNAQNSSETWAWSYSFPGDSLKLCDQSVCYTFSKVATSSL